MAYVRQHFAAQLTLSLLWMRLGAHVVHYERLKTDPLRVADDLATFLPSVPTWRVHAAIVLSDFARMKRHSREAKDHLRKGASGEWRTALPPEILEVFATQEPYPSQFEALRYTLAGSARVAPFDGDPTRGILLSVVECAGRIGLGAPPP